jgi:hypothetical protein
LGWLQEKWPRSIGQKIVIGLFLLAPLSSWSFYLFAAAMG